MERVKVRQPCIVFSLSLLNTVVSWDAPLNSWQEIDSVTELCLSLSVVDTHTHTHTYVRTLTHSHTHTHKVLGYHLWVLHQLASTQLAGRSDKVPNMLPNGPSQMNEILRCLFLFFSFLFLHLFFFFFCTSSSSTSSHAALIHSALLRSD